MPTRIATYNIHRCIGRDGVRDPQRIARVLREIDADLIALQEVSFQMDRPGDTLDAFADAVGGHAIRGPTFFRGDAHYGNAILTRITPLQTTLVDISNPGREPRGAIELILPTPSGEIHLVATHLGLSPAERRRQVRKLLSLLDDSRAPIRVLLGDLNEWFLWGRPLRWLKQLFELTLAPLTFPAFFPLFALDRIWIAPAGSLVSLRPVRTRLTRMASDHLPLVAELEARPVACTPPQGRPRPPTEDGPFRKQSPE